MPFALFLLFARQLRGAGHFILAHHVTLAQHPRDDPSSLATAISSFRTTYDAVQPLISQRLLDYEKYAVTSLTQINGALRLSLDRRIADSLLLLLLLTEWPLARIAPRLFTNYTGWATYASRLLSLHRLSPVNNDQRQITCLIVAERINSVWEFTNYDVRYW